MANTPTNRPTHSPNYTGPRFFGAPVGDFSVFQTLLLTVACGVASFFLATFLAIMGMLVMTAAGHKPDFANAYRWFGLPVGITVLLSAAVYLGSLLIRRIRRQGA
jgi:hypothetical protein